MAEQVEGVGVGLAGLFGQLVEVDAALSKRCDDLAALVWIRPRSRRSAAVGAIVRTLSAA